MASRISEGPRKKRRSSVLQRVTTHKARAAWFQERATFPDRDAAPVSFASGPASIENWVELGPSNIGGRLSALAVHPREPSTIYAGAAAGGVWGSKNGGKIWKNLWDGQPTLNIGALAIDPSDSNRIYCATGEANLSGDNYPGLGVFRSTDGGTSWEHFANAADMKLPRRIGTIAINPRNPDHILLGGVTHKDDAPAAMFTTTNGGKTWVREAFISARNYFVHDIRFHPIKPGLVLAAINARGSKSGIWRSVDSGSSWQHLEQGLPAGDLFGRASLAFSPSAPEVVYALAANRFDGVLGVFRSSDCGDSWQCISSAHLGREEQMSYGNCIAVHPENPDFVVCGGVDLHRTRDAGRTWEQITFWDTERDSGYYAHADHHVLLMPSGNLVLDANDGGLDVSEDGGSTWQNRSSGLAITMFYDVDVSAANPDFLIGGTQDNSTVIREGSRKDFRSVLGGDGGWALVDPADETHLIGSSQRIDVSRHRKDEGWTDITPPDISDEERSKVWMTFIAMETLDAPNSRSPVILLGSDRVWGSKDDGDSWIDMSGVLDGSAISALEISSTDPRVYFAGTTNGGVFRSTDRGVTWSGDLSGPELPRRIITRIETHPVDPDIVVATSGGQWQPQPNRERIRTKSVETKELEAHRVPFYVDEGGERRPHVFLSKDGGLNWTDIDLGRLPSVPHHAAVFESIKPYRLFVSSDAGVYRSDPVNGRLVAGKWRNASGNLPKVMVVDLVYHRKSRTLTAATYGRGLWRLKLG